VLSIERKKDIYAVCSKYDVIIVEDEPYWYLQFPSAAAEEAKSRGLPVSPATPPRKTTGSSGYPFLDSLTPSFVSIDVDGRVVRLDTFSKTIAPGCRLGWITAQPEVIEKYVRCVLHFLINPPIANHILESPRLPPSVSAPSMSLYQRRTPPLPKAPKPTITNHIPQNPQASSSP